MKTFEAIEEAYIALGEEIACETHGPVTVVTFTHEVVPHPITYREHYCTACMEYLGTTREAGFGEHGIVHLCGCTR